MFNSVAVFYERIQVTVWTKFLLLKLTQLIHKTYIWISLSPDLPDALKAILQVNLLLHYQISQCEAGCTRHPRKTVNQNLVNWLLTFLILMNCILNEFVGLIYELQDAVLTGIIGIQYFIFETIWIFWLYIGCASKYMGYSEHFEDWLVKGSTDTTYEQIRENLARNTIILDQFDCSLSFHLRWP